MSGNASGEGLGRGCDEVEVTLDKTRQAVPPWRSERKFAALGMGNVEKGCVEKLVCQGHIDVYRHEVGIFSFVFEHAGFYIKRVEVVDECLECLRFGFQQVVDLLVCEVLSVVCGVRIGDIE